MSEIWCQDIENAIITRLKDDTNGLQAQLTIIDAARSQTTPAISDDNINDERQDNNPECVVDYETSKISSYFGDTDLSNLRKSGSVVVSIFLSSSDRINIKKYMSNYIEAITKCLQGYSVGNLTALYADEDIVMNLYSENGYSDKYCSVRFELLINGGVE